MVRLFKKLEGFLWDDGNRNKNWLKHRVGIKETEDVLTNPHNLIAKDVKHTGVETRYLAIGYNKSQRLLSIAFTIRNKHVRIISARPSSKKERIFYEKTLKVTKI